MPAPAELINLYLHLASAFAQSGQPLQRDKLLSLATAVAATSGYTTLAADCRAKILAHNPNHLFKSYPDLETLLQNEDVVTYVRQLGRIYPFEKAEYLLESYRLKGYQGTHGFERELAHTSPDSPPARSEHSSTVKRPTATGPDMPALPGEPPGLAQRSGLPADRPGLPADRKRRSVASRELRREHRPESRPRPQVQPSPAPEVAQAHPFNLTMACWVVFALAIGIVIGGIAGSWLLR